MDKNEQPPLERIVLALDRLNVLRNELQKISTQTPDEIKHVGIDNYFLELNSCDITNKESVKMPLNFHMQQTRLDRALMDIDIDAPSPLRWLNSLSDGYLIDIGANLGLYSAFCLSWGYKRVIAIDPLPSNFLGLLQLKLLNPQLPFDPIFGACSPYIPLRYGQRSNSNFMKMCPTVGTFAGASHVKPVPDKATFKSISLPYQDFVSPTFSILDLLKGLKLASNETSFKRVLEQCVIKIDVDSIDFKILLSILTSGIAPYLKAIITEKDNEYDETLLNNLLEEIDMKIEETDGSNVLIMKK